MQIGTIGRDMIEATYACAGCGGRTGRVALTRPDEPIPIPSSVQGVPPGTDRIASSRGWASISLDEFGSSALTSGSADEMDQYEAAIHSGSAEQVFMLDAAAMPYWCRLCGETYCRSCWTTTRMTADNLYAECPHGHPRKLWGD